MSALVLSRVFARSRLRRLVEMGIFLVLAGPASAQNSPVGQVPPGNAPDSSVYFVADSLYLEGRHREALALLEGLLSRSPHDAPAHSLAAREALLVEQADPAPEGPRWWLERALDHAEEGVRLAPEAPDARYLILAAKGRLTFVAGPLERARLGAEVDAAARELLRDFPDHAGAHNALGRVYLEIAQLSWVDRVLARPLLGRDLLQRATMESAEHHLRAAVRLQPERNFHHLDLGVLLAASGDRTGAIQVLEAAVRVPLEIPGQEMFRRQARELLEELRGGRD